tara:strand:+ start:3769 stop:4413 length:645 start_codon:yes stop_codon:yes gene_type:complete
MMHIFEEQLNIAADNKIEEERAKKDKWRKKGCPPKKSAGSMCELLFPGKISTQSWNIKFGHIMEAALKACIPRAWELDITHIVCKDAKITKKSKKSKRTQLDIIFKQGDTIFYLESKNNLNLDTTKRPGEVSKVDAVKEALQQEYPGKKVVNKIVCGRLPTTPAILGEYGEGDLSSDNVIGYNDFFALLGVPPINPKDWARMIADQGDKFETVS